MIDLMERAISEIKVGNRHRKQLGDLTSLQNSISEIGLLHPIVTLPDGTLLAGQRRLEACRKLGWTSIPATTATDLAGASEQLIVERDENTCRVDMLPSEKANLGIALEAIEKPAAEERKKAAVKFTGAGDTRDLVGTAIGLSGPSYEKAARITKAAHDRSAPPETRAAAQAALTKMDKTGKIDGAYRDMQKALHKEEAPPPDPSDFSDRQKSQARNYKEQTWVNLRSLSSLVEGMSVTAERIAAAATPDDYAQMAEMLEEPLKALKALRQEFLNKAA